MQVTRINSSYDNRQNNVTFKKILRNDIPLNAIRDKKFILIVSGPSGVGKNAIMDKIMNDFNKVVTHTTREPRAGETDTIDYFFTTKDEFKRGIKHNKFAEWIEGFGGNYYGTAKETIKRALDGKKPALAIIDVEGAKKIRDAFQDDPQVKVVSVFFRPPSFEVLASRLRGRDAKPAKTAEEAKAIEKAIQERLGKAEYEIGRANEYDAEIAFNSPEEGIKDMKELFHLD